MTKISTLVGCYKIKGKQLLHNSGLKLLIANRSNTSKAKTPLFLVNKSIDKGGYISSLYPLVDVGAYGFDYQGVKYELVLNEPNQIAEIKRK